MSVMSDLDVQRQERKYEPKHKRLLRMCGVRMAALYLRNRGYTAEQAVTLLFR